MALMSSRTVNVKAGARAAKPMTARPRVVVAQAIKPENVAAIAASVVIALNAAPAMATSGTNPDPSFADRLTDRLTGNLPEQSGNKIPQGFPPKVDEPGLKDVNKVQKDLSGLDDAQDKAGTRIQQGAANTFKKLATQPIESAKNASQQIRSTAEAQPTISEMAEKAADQTKRVKGELGDKVKEFKNESIFNFSPPPSPTNPPSNTFGDNPRQPK